MSIQNMKKARIVCHGCSKTISGAKTVIAGQWHCPDCTYLHDYPDAQVTPSGVTRRRHPEQKERLFDPGPAKAKHEERW